ncbi:MAG TPA: DNA polymerase [Clostridia bacterium]|nr:DNA polymerase [Clostridia bacterium]
MTLIQYIPKESSKICFVGKAPGEVEMRTRVPFSGPEGFLFNKLLRLAGIERTSVYITNTVHVRPTKNIYETLSKQTIEDGKDQLISDLSAWKEKGLTTVIAVGGRALEMLTGASSVIKYRGTAFPCAIVEGLKVYGTLHPEDLIRGNGLYEPIVVADIKKAVADSETSEVFYPERNIEILHFPEQAINKLESVTAIEKPVTVDIETSGPVMTSYGVGLSANNAFVIPYDLLKLPALLKAIGKFAMSNTPKIFHNALFDVFHNAYYYKILNRNIYFDTMLAQHAVYPTYPKSLAFCGSIYTKEPYWKDEGKSVFSQLSSKDALMNSSLWDTLYIYNGKDCCLTYEVYEALLTELEDWKVRPTFELSMELLQPCLYAMLTGLRVDELAVQEFADKNEKAIEIMERIKEHAIGPINIKSHKQLKELIYDTWRMPVQKKQGKITTEDKKLARLASFPTPYKARIELIRKLKESYKKRDFYTLKLDTDGRIRYALNIGGTYTGRMSSSKSITGSGMNFQNQPKEVRSFYIADPGEIFVQVDLSQAEARVVAALCKDIEWLEAFDKEDLHSKTASFLYNIPIEKVEKKTHRQVAKRVAHGTHYGLGKMLLSEILECSMGEAERLKNKYHNMHPKLHEWQERVHKTVKDKKVIVTPFGRVMQFFGPLNDSRLREAVAAEPQSISAEYLNRGLIRCWKTIPNFKFKLQVHDSILVAVKDDINIINYTMLKMKRLIEQKIDVHGIEMIIPCDFEIGYSWGKMVEVKDLAKVKEIYETLQKKDM